MTTTQSPANSFSQRAEAISAAVREMKWQDQATLLAPVGMLGLMIGQKVLDHRANWWLDRQFARNDNIIAAEQAQLPRRRIRIRTQPSSTSRSRDL